MFKFEKSHYAIRNTQYVYNNSSIDALKARAKSAPEVPVEYPATLQRFLDSVDTEAKEPEEKEAGLGWRSDAARKRLIQGKDTEATFLAALLGVMGVLQSWQEESLLALPIINTDKACIQMLRAIMEGLKQ